MAPVDDCCFYRGCSAQSESENESGTESERGGTTGSATGASSLESASYSGRYDYESGRSSPIDSQESESSADRGRPQRRTSVQYNNPRYRTALSASPVDGEAAAQHEKSPSRSPSPGDKKSESGSPARRSEGGHSGSESPAGVKGNASVKNSERIRSTSPEVNETRKSRSRSAGSNNSRQSSPEYRTGSGDSENESKHSKARSESPGGKDGAEIKSSEKGGGDRAGYKSLSKKSGSHSRSDSEDNFNRKSKQSVSPKPRSQSGSPSKRGSRSPQEKSRSDSPPGDKSRESDSDEGGAPEAGRKRKRAILSDDSGSDGEKKKLDTGDDKDDGDESEKDLVIDAEALFGDASDISSDEEGKRKKGEKKTSENEGERSQGEESDAGSNKAKSGDEDNEMEIDDKDEEDKENIPEEPIPETRIDVQIPKITTDLGKEIHFVKLPNFLSVETRPFDPLTYEDEIDEEETLDEEGRARLKLKVENTIRWREVTKQNGEFEKQSNARFVKWSDGSLSLHLGSEIFDVCKQPLQGDHNHLFIRQGTGLQGQAVFRTKLTFRPHSTESFTHRKMTLSLADRSQKTARIKVLSLVGKDPEAHRGELIKTSAAYVMILLTSESNMKHLSLKFQTEEFQTEKEEEKLRASVRRESKQRRIREKGANRGLSAGYLEPDRYGDGDSDDEGISINAIKKQHRNKLSNQKDDRSHIYSSDEDGSDIETRRARRLDKAKALKDSDSEGSGGGGGGGDKSGDRSSSGED